MSEWVIPTVDNYDASKGEIGSVYSKSTSGSSPTRVSVSIGGKHVKYAMLSESGGTQPMRTQFDVAMDGKTIYTLNAGKGIGSHTLTLFDGPFTCGTAPEGGSILKNYPKGDLEGRKIVIVYAVRNGNEDVKTTFKGIINSLSTVTMDSGGGSVVVATTVKATGMWGK